MKRVKKAISILLSFTMVLSFFTIAPINVSAENVSDQLMLEENADNRSDEALRMSTDSGSVAVLQETADGGVLQDSVDSVGDEAAQESEDNASNKDLQKNEGEDIDSDEVLQDSVDNTSDKALQNNAVVLQEIADDEVPHDSSDSISNKDTQGNADSVSEEALKGDTAKTSPTAEKDPGTAAFEESETVDGMTVTVKAGPGVFPVNAMLSVGQVSQYRQSQADSAVDEVRDEDVNVAASYTFDLRVVNPETGEEYQPAEGQTVSISFSAAEMADGNLATQVYHVKENETTGELSAEKLDLLTDESVLQELPADGSAPDEINADDRDNTVVVETDGFSYYTVEFTYNKLQYVLNGDSTVSMEEILSAVGLTGEVTSAEVSNDSLFSVSDGTGEWMVTAHQAFETIEWMKVTIGGVVYEITVTDAVSNIKNVKYIVRSWNGSTVTDETKYKDVPQLPASTSVSGGWYYLNRNVTVKGRMSFTGDTSLILGDGYKLDVKGMHIPKGSTLTIYGQSEDTGTIYSHPDGGAGIGAYKDHKGGNIVIHGGKIDADGHNNCAGIGANDDDRKDIGAITIYGGNVDATGGDSGAGIGGGRACEGGKITIYGGTVTAKGGHYAAGIGGGNGLDSNPLRGAHAGTITIWGGTVTATGGDDGAGIGGGEGGNAGTITINGGTVTCTGGNNSAGIGCGEGESTGVGGTVTINGGTVKAYGGGDAAGIGGGEKGHCDTITISDGEVTATGGGNGAGIGAGRDSDGGTIRITGGTVTATGKDSSAGIGGGDASDKFADYSTIEISGGTVTATGNSKGAGIGGGEYGHAAVTISGGTVTATGGPDGGAGIGNGVDGNGSSVTITGGQIKAKASSGGAGIGKGKNGSAGTITLGYTDATRETIKISTSSYNGTVKLNKPFKNDKATFRETSSVSDLGSLAAGDLVAWIEADTEDAYIEINSWSGLQSAINQAGNGTTISLTDSITANGGSIIKIPSGLNMTLDLNGKTMDRQLKSCIDNGGVIRVEPNATLTVIDSSKEKTGRITGGASWNGGGICNHGTLYFKGGTISGNQSIHSTHGGGGGIFSSRFGDSDPDAVLYITGGVVEGNTARNGGGIYLSNTCHAEISGVTIRNNTANATGGGIYHDAPSLSVMGHVTVQDNTANTGNNIYLFDGCFLGVTGTLASDTKIGVTMANAAGNITSGLKGRGGEENFTSDNTSYTIGIDGGGEAYLSTTAKNTVNTWSALLDAVNNASNGDLIQLSGDVINTENKDRIIVSGKTITIDLNGYTIDRKRGSKDRDGHVFEVFGNLTIRDSAGGGIITGGWANNGGGINIGNGGKVTFTGGTISGNKGDDGGGVHVKNGGTFVMTGGTVTDNTASEYGGGIYVSNEGRIELTGAEISHNTASDDGGGIKAHLKSDSTITRCTITYNRSGDYGGGVHFDASGKKLTITDTNIDHNSSSDDGAGIHLLNGTIVMNGGSLSDNYSENDGGGAKIRNSAVFTASGVIISGNTARDEEGGGIKTFGTTTLKDCTISNNKSQKQGGGLFNDDSDGSPGRLTLENCSITGNSSNSNGGGVYSDKKLTLIGGSITGNSAGDRGGGVFIGDDSNDTSIGGGLVVKDNRAVIRGVDLFLRTHKLVLKAALTDDAEIGITKENDKGIGIFTSGYSTFNGTKDPALYFFSPEGLDIVFESGEASLASAWPDLRAEIRNAANGATITLSHNYTASSKDDYLEIPENRTITIDLNSFTLNRNRTSSGGDGHVFWVKKGASLTLTDSTAIGNNPGTGTITGGYSKRGGGIYVDENATCTIRNINISNNNASDDGGGIYVKGVLDMKDSRTSGNEADDLGGGIYSHKTGSITLDHVVITQNTADDDGGGLSLCLGADSSITGSEITGNRSGDYSGGIHLEADGRKLTITNTNIDNNTSHDDGAGIHLRSGTIVMSGGSVTGNTSDCDGGGIKIRGNTSFTATGVTISNNKAKGEEGGGLKNYGTTKLTNCTVSGNSAGKQGGGIYNDNDGKSAGDLTLENCTVTDNTSKDNGGGIYSDRKLTIIGGTGAKITGNTSGKQGGGIYVGKDSESTCIREQIVIENNKAVPGKDVYLRSGQKLKLTGAITGTKIGMIEMDNLDVFTQGYSTYHSNTEPSTFFCKDAGAIPVEWNNGKTEAQLKSYWPALQALIDAEAKGGTVTLDRDYTAGAGDDRLRVKEDYNVTIDLNGHTLNRNLASKDDDGHVIQVFKNATLTVKDSSDKNNTDDELGTGIITGGYSAKGGGIYIGEKGTLNFQSGTIVGNKATDHGGGILNYGTLNMTGGLVYGNSADDNGGGIYSSDSSSLTLSKVFIFSNIAGNHGGGLNIRLKNDAIITECSIIGNCAADNGGGVRLDAKEKTLTINNTKIDENLSIDDGAGIYLHNGTIRMNGGSLSGNGSSNDGGGAKITDNTTFTAESVEIKNNKAVTEEGGGIKTYGVTTLTNCTITGNSAAKEGGGIFNDDDDSKGSLKLNGCTIKDNTSQKSGGGVYSDKELKIIGGTISGNTAQDKGGGIYIGGGSKETGIEGNPVIKDNEAMNFGNNLYLRSGKKLLLTGALIERTDSNEGEESAELGEASGGMEGTESTEDKEDAEESPGADIYVDMESGTGVLTKDYKKHNQTKNAKNEPVAKDPEQFFTFATGYDAGVNDKGEVELTSGWKTLKETIESTTGDEPVTLDRDYAASSSDDRIKIPKNRSITVDLNGHTLNRNRNSKDNDGHVFEVYGTLNLTDSSASDGKPGKGIITGGWAKNGGGINISETGILNLEGGTISGNRATDNGGGVYVYGTMNMKGGIIKDNASEDNGGGIYLNKNSSLSLESGKVTGNDAGKQGGGIKVESGAKTNVKGSPAVSGNHASKDGHDVYLPARYLLTVTGPFTEGAEIGIALQDTWGTFTNRYGRFNGNHDPALYFASTEGHAVYSENEEAVLGLSTYGQTEYEDPFISGNNQVNTDSDTLSSQNWMSGISGDRYLQEINTPGSHDSAMNNVVKHYNTTAQLLLDVGSALWEATAALTLVAGIVLAPFTGGASFFAGLGFFLTQSIAVVALNVAVPTDWTSGVSIAADSRAADMAKTQKEYIDQQLNEGARQLDIRLNNRKKVYKFIGKDVFNGWKWEDDGKNLWLCHGKSGGGTYQAEDHDGNKLSFNQVLIWVEEFLEKHPTETIILDIRPETEKKEDHQKIYERAKAILEVSAMQINPSTGEPFLYKEDESDDYFAPYTHMPMLSDCRGKIVLMPENDEFLNSVGGFLRGSLVEECFDELDYQNTPSMMVKQVQEVYGRTNGDGHVKLPTDVNTDFDRLWYWELNCTGEHSGWTNYIVGDTPHVNAEFVNPNLIGDKKTFGPDRTGQYIGWVRMDSFEAKYAEEIWKTNFFDDLEYCTVTVESGLDDPNYPDQTYQVLKGTKITVPSNIYKKLDTDRYFGSWKAEDSNGSTVCEPGESFKINEDITFTAQWLEEGVIPVRILWEDGDDADELRPDSIDLTVSNNQTSRITLRNEEDWNGMVEGTKEGPITITPDWSLIDITAENPQGQDTEGQYRYEASLEGGNGYTLTLIHTPQTKVTASGAVTWEDDDNAGNTRPENVTIRLLRNGTEIKQMDVSAASGWQYDFGEYAQYENGEKIDYSIIEDDMESYVAAIEGFYVTNTYAADAQSIESITGTVEWDDAGDAKNARPESVTVTLLADGEETSSQKVTSSDSALWIWSFDDVPKINEEGNPIKYTVKEETVSGYSVELLRLNSSEITDAALESDSETEDRESNLYRIKYTLQVSEEEKEPAVISALPDPQERFYNGEAQTLIKEGEAEGGTVMYALGRDAENAPESGYSTSLPAGTDIGTYYVWFYVKGDVLHTDTAPACLTATISEAEITAPVFRTQSLILDGRIGVNFFMDLPAIEGVEYGDSYVTFSITGNGTITDQDNFDPDFRDQNNRGYYGFTCYVNSIQMADTITATYHYTSDGEEKTVEKEYSVKKYIETFDTYKGLFDEKTVALVESLADYGHYVQPFLSNVRDWNIGTDYAEMENYYTDSYDIGQIQTAVKDYEIIRKNENPDIDEITYFLTLDSETAVNVYFKPVEGYTGSFTVTVDGEKAEVAESGGQYQVKIANIAAHQLGRTHTIVVTTGNGSSTVKVSALSYVQGLLASSSDTNARNAAAALYSYFKAADDYLN